MSLISTERGQALSLFDTEGRPKYLNASELAAVERAARMADDLPTKAFALTLIRTGARPSELLGLTAASIDWDDLNLRIRTLKKRRTSYRVIPIAPNLAETLSDLLAVQRIPKGSDRLLWSWSRKTAQRKIKRLFAQAGISEWHSAKSCRHGFAVRCVQKDVPLSVISSLLGHSSPAVTAVYVDVLGTDRRELVSRLWD